MANIDCWVCARELDFHAVGSCGHNDMCLYCSCRLRILMKDIKCPICKTESPKVLITKNPNARFEDYPGLESSENEYGIICEDDAAQNAFSRITSFNCWLPNCRESNHRTQAQLKKHIEYGHKLRFCKVCLNSRLIFIWEQKLYPPNDIPRHIEFGEIDEIPPHRTCLFDNKLFYDENELKLHLDREHYFCNICEGENYLFYANHDKLKKHFQKAHYVCHDPICTDSRFSVFRTPYDLQMHTVSVHMSNQKLTKSQKTQLAAIQVGTDELPNRPNNEGVDFRAQFKPKKNEDEEVKDQPKPKPKNSKKYVVNKRPEKIVDYKTLPKRPDKEVINMIKEALDNDENKYTEFKTITVDYNKGHIAAVVMLTRFIDLLGNVQGEALFPILITTVRQSEKQEELFAEYIHYMESRQNVTSDGRCHNSLADCSNEASILKALLEIVAKELEKRKNEPKEKPLFIHTAHLFQMAAVVDRLKDQDMVRLMFIMNFGVTDKTKGAIINMIDKANDRAFNEKLTVKYEDYFVSDLEPQQLYILHKYFEMCIAKLKGLPFKDDQKLLSNWEEEKAPEEVKKEVIKNEEEEEKGERVGWGNVLMKKKAKAPRVNEPNFPSLAGNSQSGPNDNWSRAKNSPFPQRINNEFPSLGQNQNFPSLGAPPAEDFPSLSPGMKDPLEPSPIKEEKPVVVQSLPEPPKQDEPLDFLRSKGIVVKQGKNKRKRK